MKQNDKINAHPCFDTSTTKSLTNLLDIPKVFNDSLVHMLINNNLDVIFMYVD